MDPTIQTKFEQILALSSDTEKLEDAQQVTPYLRYLTGCRYRLEQTNYRRWADQESPLEEGVFYQILPDQVDNGFYNWYCNNRPYHQLYRTPEMALLQFIFYWHVWQKEVNKNDLRLSE
jgi:hypothetical protein